MGAFLDKPITEKDTHRVAHGDMTVGVSSMQGWRIDMEDAHTIEPRLDGHDKLAWFAVFDGHGGSRCAIHSAQHVLRHIMSTEEFKEDQSPPSIGAGIRRGFLNMDAELRELPDVRRGEDHSGCTAVGVMVTPTHFICGNSGDSRSILVRKSGTIPLSWDHKPYNEGELKRITAAGGSVSMRRVNGDLAVSRALGDFVYKQTASLPPEKQQVSAEPDIHIEERREDDDYYVVIACDGIWDVMTNEECGEFITSTVSSGCADLGTLCEELLTHCLNKGSRDNMSAVIIGFPAAPQPSAEKIAEFSAEKAKEVATAARGAGSGAGAGSA